ncbi:MAG: FCD domain-containing protein [Pigmentiphaga sp.]|uniref:FadR/GntR family transcriptional regulator n=1 Tax=Pigmentiphaga sp. TaxID=1977564 RepID=UPI0029BD6436|nr:FCD domain-containing protein [Pigmentiphaga sp.]MDX3904956.1 FCD domain-containing protein [Pigmentiphaga sp.]
MARTRADLPVWRAGRTESTAMRVEKQIKEAVLDGKLLPGDFLGSENDLAEQFQVSRLPIREAMGRLQALGVVDVRTGAGGGTRIANGNDAPVVEALAIQLKLMGVGSAEVFDAQVTIEASAAEMAAKLATSDDIAHMRACLAQVEELVSDQEAFTPEKLTNASLAFHQSIVDAAHNQFLSSIMKAISYVLYRSVNPYTTTAVGKRLVQRHRKLLAAIMAKDSALARQLVTEHVAKVRAKHGAAAKSPVAGN